MTYGSKKYSSGIMRIAFAKGNLNFAKSLKGGVVLSDTEPLRSYGIKEKMSIENWSRKFHTYTLEWRPGKHFKRTNSKTKTIKKHRFIL